jgi:hypothetical protein
MAEIVLGIGCAHAPQLHTPVEEWEQLAQRDTRDAEPFWYKGERANYDELLKARSEQNIDEQLGIEICKERIEKSQEAIYQLSEIFAEAQPDITIVFGNDQGEMFLDDVRPAFSIMGCEKFENMPRTAEQVERLPPHIHIADAGHLPDKETQVFLGHPVLARYLVESAMKHNFDITYSHRQHRADPTHAHTAGMSHAYGFVYKQIFRNKPVPHVPIDINTFFPPNQPDASRCHALGRMIGKAVRAWDNDLRVAVIASGGLSHPVVDEDFDRDIIEAMEGGDLKYLLSYHDGYYQSGSSEIKSWIAMNGALRGSYLKGHLVDYQALYRTPAGTGSSAAFMYWKL